MWNPKPNLHNINAHIKFGEYPLRVTGYCPETKIRTCCGQITLSKINEICAFAIPKQFYTILMHIPSLVMDVSRANNYLKNWRNLSLSNSKPDLHNIDAKSKFGENPLIFTYYIIIINYHPEMKIRTCCGQITFKNWIIMPISTLKPDFHNITAHTKLGENLSTFT